MSSIGTAAPAGIQQILALRQQIVDRSSLLQQIQAADGQANAPVVTGQDKFAGVLRGALDAVNSSQMKADSLSEAYERGDGIDIAKVMLARQEAGVAFEATLQVRNKLLSTYQEIMRTGV